MLEMVFTKTNLDIAKYYDQRLVDESLWPLGESLREQLRQDIQVVLAVENSDNLMEQNPWGAEAIRLRNIYVEPLNMLQ
ncbi:phosphoenolpyruvate carboxylase, partial [Klebsiella pneumoniae]